MTSGNRKARADIAQYVESIPSGTTFTAADLAKQLNKSTGSVGLILREHEKVAHTRLGHGRCVWAKL